jgi:hypothetical protein
VPLRFLLHGLDKPPISCSIALHGQIPVLLSADRHPIVGKERRHHHVQRARVGICHRLMFVRSWQETAVAFATRRRHTRYSFSCPSPAVRSEIREEDVVGRKIG